MSKELAEKLETIRKWYTFLDEDAVILKEAIAALRAEPVATILKNMSGQIFMVDQDGNAFDMSKYVGAQLYAAPSREDQRSEPSSGLNGDVPSVSPRISSSAPNGVERTGNSAQIDTVTGRRDDHPTGDELLREAREAMYLALVGSNGLTDNEWTTADGVFMPEFPASWSQSIDLMNKALSRIDAHLSRKEQ